MDPTQKLIEAAEAVCDRWDSPLWKDAKPTADYIAALRTALRGLREARAEPVLTVGGKPGDAKFGKVFVGPPAFTETVCLPAGTKLYATPPTTDAPAQWISVDERLPTPRDDGRDVPVWTWNGEFVTEDDYAEQFEQPAGPAVGGWISTGWDFYQNASVGRAAVTHWMPRETPKPPTAAPTKDQTPNQSKGNA